MKKLLMLAMTQNTFQINMMTDNQQPFTQLLIHSFTHSLTYSFTFTHFQNPYDSNRRD
jgi:hypothetical protein